MIDLLYILSSIIIAFGVPVMAYYIRKLEKNTNSMREQLVEATAKLGVQTGIKQEKERAKHERDS